MRVRAVELGLAVRQPLLRLEVDGVDRVRGRLGGIWVVLRSGVVREHLLRRVELRQVLAEQDRAGRRVDDGVVVGDRRRLVGQVPRQTGPGGRVEQHEAGEVAAREARDLSVARGAGRDVDRPLDADVALERAHRGDGADIRHDRGDAQARDRRARDAEDPAAAVEAHAQVVVERGDAAERLPVAQVRDARGGARRAVGQGQPVDVGRGEPEGGAVAPHPVERDGAAIPGGRAGQRAVEALDAPRRPGERVDLHHGLGAEAAAQPRACRSLAGADHTWAAVAHARVEVGLRRVGGHAGRRRHGRRQCRRGQDGANRQYRGCRCTAPARAHPTTLHHLDAGGYRLCCVHPLG